MVSQRGVAGAEVDRVQTARREVGDVRPCLLGADNKISGPLQRAYRRRVHNDSSRLGVADDVERRAIGYETREIRLRLRGRAVRRVAEVQRGGCLSRDHVVCNAGVEPRHGDDLAELETADDCDAWRELEEGLEPVDGTLEGAVGEPRSGGVAARPREHEPCHDVAEASGLELEVRRLEHDCKRCAANRLRALEDRRERVVLGRELLSSEEEQANIARRRSEIEIPGELDGHGETALHVAGA